MSKSTTTNSAFNVPPGLISHGQKELEQFITANGMKKHRTTPNDFLFKNNLSNNSKVAYRRHWKELRNFFFLIGDYQSALLCDRSICPTDPLPFSTTGLVLYLDFRCGKPSTTLLDPLTACPKLDIYGKNIIVIGDWMSPSNLHQLAAAVKHIHDMYPESTTGPYTENCIECTKLNCSPDKIDETYSFSSVFDERMTESVMSLEFFRTLKKTMGLYHSCRKHAMRPNLSARGNIFNHTLNKRHFDFYMQYKKKVHLERGCGQFYPVRNQDNQIPSDDIIRS